MLETSFKDPFVTIKERKAGCQRKRSGLVGDWNSYGHRLRQSGTDWIDCKVRKSRRPAGFGGEVDLERLLLLICFLAMKMVVEEKDDWNYHFVFVVRRQ